MKDFANIAKALPNDKDLANMAKALPNDKDLANMANIAKKALKGLY